VVDGISGPETQNAIRSYQIDRGLPVTGRIDSEFLSDLGQ
jgi:peptidoglycan hydrolase-like protein with peptidoglycan-binding domain